MRESKLIYNYIKSYLKQITNKNIFKKRYLKLVTRSYLIHLYAWSDDVFDLIAIFMEFIRINNIDLYKVSLLSNLKTRIIESKLILFYIDQDITLSYNIADKKITVITNNIENNKYINYYDNYYELDGDSFKLYAFCHYHILSNILEVIRNYIDEYKEFKWLHDGYIN